MLILGDVAWCGIFEMVSNGTSLQGKESPMDVPTVKGAFSLQSIFLKGNCVVEGQQGLNILVIELCYHGDRIANVAMNLQRICRSLVKNEAEVRLKNFSLIEPPPDHSVFGVVYENGRFSNGVVGPETRTLIEEHFTLHSKPPKGAKVLMRGDFDVYEVFLLGTFEDKTWDSIREGTPRLALRLALPMRRKFFGKLASMVYPGTTSSLSWKRSQIEVRPRCEALATYWDLTSSQGKWEKLEASPIAELVGFDAESMSHERMSVL
jgi:hypothetical protein